MKSSKKGYDMQGSRVASKAQLDQTKSRKEGSFKNIGDEKVKFSTKNVK